MKHKIVQLDAFSVTGVKKLASKENGANLINIPQMWADFPDEEMNNMQALYRYVHAKRNCKFKKQ